MMLRRERLRFQRPSPTTHSVTPTTRTAAGGDHAERQRRAGAVGRHADRLPSTGLPFPERDLSARKLNPSDTSVASSAA
jgi:hypothetical protein